MTTESGSRSAPWANVILSGSLSDVSSERVLDDLQDSLVDPSGGMDFVPLQRTMVWVDASKVYILAEIVSSVHTEKALPTGYTRLQGDTITSLYVVHFVPYLDNDSSCFVSKYAVTTYNQTPNHPSFPEVDI
jgi:hypothetical protein